MPVSFTIKGDNDEGSLAKVEITNAERRAGIRKRNCLLISTTDPVVTPFTRPFSNDTLGVEMAQNVTFSGNATIVHAGVNSGAALTGTTTGTTSSHLIDSGETFSGIAVGMSVKNTTSGNEYALVTVVSVNDLTLDADIFVSGENYEINPIWVGTATSGTWNFADSGKITITSADNNDIAEFENDTNQQWDVSKVTDFTGKIDLDVYNSSQNTITFQFNLNGTPVGSAIALNDFIDTGNFAEQSFVISHAEFQFATNIINGLTITIGRSAGAKPTVKFDDMQWEEIGESITFTVAAVENEIIRINEIIFSFTDDITGIAAVSGATENATMIALAYNKILGLTKLANGLTFRRIEDNKVVITLTFRQILDFTRAGAVIDTTPYGDGTNTVVTLTVRFPEPVILYAISGDFMALTVNDPMNGLISFTTFARGTIEVE